MTASEGDSGLSELSLWRLPPTDDLLSSWVAPTGVESNEESRSGPPSIFSAIPLLAAGFPSSEMSVMRAVNGWYSLTVESDDIREWDSELFEEEV